MIFIALREQPKGPNLGRAVKAGPISRMKTTRGCPVCKANKKELAKTWKLLAKTYGVIPGPLSKMEWHQQLYKEIWEAQEAHFKNCSQVGARARTQAAKKYLDHMGYLQRLAKQTGNQARLPGMWTDLLKLEPKKVTRAAVVEIMEKHDPAYLSKIGGKVA